jgi:N-acetylglucosamine-6-phosphate deacetylase
MIGKQLQQPKGRLALVNGRVILPEQVVTGRAVIVEDRQIVGIDDLGTLGSDVQKIDAGGRYVTPGLIDIHTHGGVGHNFNEPAETAFAAITAENARRGVTSMLATITTAPTADILECLEFSRAWMSQPREGTQLLGVHQEGPYFSLAQAGAQDPANIRLPDDGTPDQLLEYRDIIRILTYAPELPGALELTARLARLGIVPAAGHSSAKDEDVRAAMQAGLRHVIHLWSGQSSTVREGPWRKPGLLEASLVFEGLTAEIIADNRHLPPTLMKLAYKCIGPDRLCAVSDATNGAGLPEGAHFTMGQMSYDILDGVAMLPDRTAFAGSSTLLNQMLPILTDVVGIPLPEATRMVSLNPARVISFEDRKGSLEAGKDADISIYEDDFTAWRTMIGGQWAYAA